MSAGPAYDADNEPGFLKNELRILPNPYLYDDTALQCDTAIYLCPY